jgi:hypothetical protein
MYWTHTAQDRIEWQAFVMTIMKLRVAYIAGSFD